MLKKIIDFIKELFCKKCDIQGKAIVAKSSKNKKEATDKKKNPTTVKKKSNDN
jgi:hypothetical protein